jgi:Ca2+-binding RTX toxin-like protein
MSDEFLVNTYGDAWQNNPDVATLADGSFVIVWDSFYTGGDDDFYYIAAQRFSASGERIGGEMVLDADTTGQSRHASITALNDGGFAVAWEASEGSILEESDVFTRAFDRDGRPRGASVMGHKPNGESQYAASISATEDGYTLSYTGYRTGTDRWDDIFLQRFDNDGAKINTGTQVNQFTEYDQHTSRTVTLNNGNVLIAWESQYAGFATPSEVNENAVRGRIYSDEGKALTNEFLLIGENDGMVGGVDLTESSVDVAVLGKGFVVTWYQTELHEDDDTTFEIHAQRFTDDGRKTGADILVRGGPESVPKHSGVTGLDGGGFVVTWDAFGEYDDQQDSFARVYDAAGNALGSAFRIHPASYRTNQETPEVAALDGGGFVVTYMSEGLDVDNDAIGARIFGQGGDGADSETMLWRGRFDAGGGNDRIAGTSGVDSILGGSGRDELRGNGGDDRLDGGSGDDSLIGGSYADRLTGGSGKDLFRFGSGSDTSNSNPDRIVDFRSGFDRIDLAHIDANTGRSGDQAFRFLGEGAFSRKAGELRFDDGVLTGDVDGNGRADFTIRIDDISRLATADLIL